MACLAAACLLGRPGAWAQEGAGGRYGGTTEAGRAFQLGQASSAEGDRAFERGQADDAREAYEAAAEHYRDALSLDEEYEEARERLAYVLYVMDRSDEAIEVLTEGLEISPRSLPLRRMMGINLIEIGRVDEGIGILRAVDDEGGASADVLFILGKQYYETSDYRTAAEYFQRYLAEDPSDVATHGALGNAYLRTDQYELALVEFRTVLELDPGNLTALTNVGDVYFASGDYTRAIEIYTRVLPDDPDNYRVWFNLGKSQIELAQWDEALTAFDRMVELRDDIFQGHYFRGVALIELERYSDASLALRRAIGLSSGHALSYYRLGIAEGRLGNTPAAIEALERAREITPDEPWFAHELGNVLASQGRFDEARQHHAFAVATSPEEPAFHEALGRDDLGLGALDEAVGSLERSLELEPERPSSQATLSTVLLTQAQIALTEERLDDAQTVIERAASLGAHPLQTTLARATLFLLRDDPASAEATLTGLSGYESDPDYRRARAHVAVAMGQPERVADLLAHLDGVPMAELDPRDAGLLGHAAAHDEDWPRALELFERAVDSDPHYRTDVALANLRIGLRMAEHGRWSEAETHFDAADRLRSGLEEQDGLRLEYARAVTALNQENFSAAARRFSDVRRGLERVDSRSRLPRDESLRIDLRLAYAQYRIGNYADTIATLEGSRGDRTAEELLASAHERLAREEYEADNVRSARRHYEQAVESAPSNAVARNNLACLLYAEGEIDSAAEIFRELADGGTVGEALFNYAVYLDVHGDDPQGAYRYYRRYLDREGDDNDVAREAVRVKEEVFGFEPDG